MTKSPFVVITLLSFFAISLSTNSCTKTPDESTEIIGDYCTFRDGINGPISSSISIQHDTTENHDYLISNISGYPNTSNAFMEIGCERVNNRLVILPYSVLMGNGNNMTVEGEGNIMDNGSINLDISIMLNEESQYSLFLSSDESSNHGTYTGESNTLDIEEGNILFDLSGVENTYSFKINQIVTNGCGFSIPRHNSLNLETNEAYQFEAEVYYTGQGIVGTVQLSPDDWQSVETIELDLK